MKSRLEKQAVLQSGGVNRFQQKRQPSQENCQLFSVRKSTFSVTIYSLFTIHVDILVFEFLKEEKFNIYNIYFNIYYIY